MSRNTEKESIQHIWRKEREGAGKKSFNSGLVQQLLNKMYAFYSLILFFGLASEKSFHSEFLHQWWNTREIFFYQLQCYYWWRRQPLVDMQIWYIHIESFALGKAYSARLYKCVYLCEKECTMYTVHCAR